MPWSRAERPPPGCGCGRRTRERSPEEREERRGGSGAPCARSRWSVFPRSLRRRFPRHRSVAPVRAARRPLPRARHFAVLYGGIRCGVGFTADPTWRAGRRGALSGICGALVYRGASRTSRHSGARRMRARPRPATVKPLTRTGVGSPTALATRGIVCRNGFCARWSGPFRATDTAIASTPTSCSTAPRNGGRWPAAPRIAQIADGLLPSRKLLVDGSRSGAAPDRRGTLAVSFPKAA